MSSLFRTKRLLLFAAIALMLPLLAACAGDDDDGDDPTATPDSAGVATTVDEETPDEVETTPEDVTTPDDAGTPEGTADDAETVESTPDAMETPDSTPDAVGTADETPDAVGTADETPDAVSTPDAVGTPDSTPDADTTPGTGSIDGPITDVSELQADVPNFTLNFTSDFENVPDETGAMNLTADIEMMLMQSEPDIYHMSMSSTGDQALQIEMWSLESSTYIAESGGEPIEVPGEAAGAFEITDAFTFVPPIESLDMAEEVGQDEVDGRTATQYRVEGQDAADMLVTTGATVTNPEGAVEIWIDEELGIMLQMQADVTFENEDGTTGSIQIDFQITDIGDTADIEAPN